MKNKKTSRKQARLQKSHERDKHMGSLSFKILYTFLKMNKGDTDKWTK